MEYLIWLQNLRGEWGEGVEKFFTIFTDASMASALFVLAIIYWCLDKQAGKFLFVAYAFSRMLTQFLKNTFCVYRPWILDSNIHPIESAMKSASSYSFPSGHTNVATSIYGGIAYIYGKKFPLVIFICAAIILLTAFSRNFLGMHTLQDVLVSIIATTLVIVLTDKLMRWIDGDDKKESIFTVTGIILALISTAYFMMKSYPVDYLNGKVIVDPVKAIEDAIGNIGTFTAILVGLEMERRFIDFKTNVPFSTKIFRAVFGVVVLLALNFLAVPFIKSLDIGMATKFFRWFMIYFSVTFLVPLIFAKVEKRFFRSRTIGGGYYGR